MTSDNFDGKRRTVLKAIGTTAIAGGAITGTVSGSGHELCWDGHGDDVDVPGCETYHYVLTTGGGSDVTEATLNPGSVPGERAGGSNTFHFRGVGAEPSDNVCVAANAELGKNAKLTLSECNVTGYQIDLIYGDPIEEFDPYSDPPRTYNGENRLLQAYWSGDGLEDFHFSQNTDTYDHCLAGEPPLSITENINVADRTATAQIDPGENCEVSDFALVSYSTTTDSWVEAEAHLQRIYDTDLTGDADGNFSVSVPPLAE